MKILSIFSFIILTVVVNGKLHERFRWKQVEFDWPCEESKQEAIASGGYVKENNLPLGLARWKNKMFITVPRWKNGVASSLNYVNLECNEVSPKLIPYPGWMENYAPADNCENNICKYNSTIVSAFRMQVDQCDRLWVMDTGLVDINGESNQVIDNSIVIFDLTTDKLIRRFNIPKDQIKGESFFPNIIVDLDVDSSDCSNAYAYLPDLGGYGVVVYSFKDNESYRVSHNFFHCDPLHGDFNVHGVNFQWTDGVFAMTIGPTNLDNSKDIYFHAFASIDEFKVSNRVLQNKTLATSPNNYYYFHHVGRRSENGQSSSEIYDKNTGVIFYSEVIKDAISCWNIGEEYKAENLGLVESNPDTLEFINDMKIDDDSNLWVLSDRMPTFLLRQLKPDNVNFRVLQAKTRDLVRGTPCQKYIK